jgi:trehalose 6-phosphate synthase
MIADGTLITQPRGRVVVVANREPFSRERDAHGRVTVRHSTSGLVTASEPLVRESGGTWIGYASGTDDAVASHELVPPGDPTYLLRRVSLTAEEKRGYYDGFSNEGLWPLCHDVNVEPVFRPRDFDTYWAVNRRFADAAIEETLHESAVILVQDYHFALAPLMVREDAGTSAVVAFWHIPWPSVRRLELCPWATYLIEGLLGAHLIGFQTRQHCASFLDAAEHLLGAEVERRRGVVTYLGRRTDVRAYPASVEWESPTLAAAGTIDACRREVCARFGLRPDDRIVAGVDRMDYTKGLEEKLEAFERMLVRYPRHGGRTVLVQIAQPTRETLAIYRDVHAHVSALAARINRQYDNDGLAPVILIDEARSPDEVYTLLRAADVCYVGSLDDGMNLVAKEYVSARDDEQGVLVLSARAGAAAELTHALLIDPRDIDGCARALDAALRMPADEQRYRMQRMRLRVQGWDARRWAVQLLDDAASLCGARALESYGAAVGA